MVREVEGCTVNKKVSSIPPRGHGGGLIGSACVLVPGCHANPLGLFYPDPGKTNRRKRRTEGWTHERQNKRQDGPEGGVSGKYGVGGGLTERKEW